jgi:fatty acid desaturase
LADSPTETVKPAKGAGLLLAVLAVAQAVPMTLALLVNFGSVQDQVVRVLDRNPEPLGETGALVIVAGATLAGAIGFLAAIILAVLAPKVSAGGARLAARVVSGLLLLWSVVVTVVNPVGGPLTLLAPGADTNNTLSDRQFQEQLDNALPGWIPPTLIGFAAVTLVLVVAVYLSLPRNPRPPA